MRISDWSSDVFSSDLARPSWSPIRPSATVRQATSNGTSIGKLIGLTSPGFNCSNSATDRLGRSEDRRGGQECVSTFRSRWQAYHSKNQHTKHLLVSSKITLFTHQTNIYKT